MCFAERARAFSLPLAALRAENAYKNIKIVEGTSSIDTTYNDINNDNNVTSEMSISKSDKMPEIVQTNCIKRFPKK